MDAGHEQAGALAAEHLVQVGARKVGIIAGDPRVRATALRSNAARRHLAAAGVEIAGGVVHTGTYSEMWGRTAARAMTARVPDVDGFLCGNDQIARGVRTRQDVERAVAAVRPDTPERSGTYGAAARRNARPNYGGGQEYVSSVAETVVGVMIEKRESFDDLDALLSVDGVDFVQWGPTDFRMSSGGTTAEIDRARGELFDACDRNGVPARIELADLSEFSDLCARGFRHFSLGIDIEMLFGAWKQLGTEARKILQTPAVVLS
ncbi:hypothetical protein SMALB_2790 [Streptomyces malaysiensis]|uniref:Transcriptional regulator LacI/GalR-like sensor domain-containing protein n=1 Tax=Streptomyces malaysiensis TaxID=92644 RepID=A0A7X5X188_STRMQ|nr:hypothetical protein [Streptomyces malaysiensis]